MNPTTLQELFRHNTWANNSLLDAAAGLETEQVNTKLGGSFSSIHDVLTHSLWAEWLWLERWQRGSPPASVRPEDYPSVPALRAQWTQIQAGQLAFMARVTEDELQAVVPYINSKGETWNYVLWQQIYHLLHHSGFHRGQVTNKFRQLGTAPPSTDYLNYRDHVG